MHPPYQLTDTAFLRSASFAATRWQISGVNGGLVGAKVQVLVTNTGGVTTSFKFQTAEQPVESAAASARFNFTNYDDVNGGCTLTLDGVDQTFAPNTTLVDLLGSLAFVGWTRSGSSPLITFTRDTTGGGHAGSVTNGVDTNITLAFTDGALSDAPAVDNLLELAIPSSGADPDAVVSTETLGGFNSTFATITSFLNTVANTAGVITLTPGARILVHFKAGAFVQLVPVTPTSIPTSAGPGILRLTASCNLPIACVSHDHQRSNSLR